MVLSQAHRLLALTAGLSAAIATFACGALPAEGETGPPGSSDAATCPSPNPPNELALMAGTPQTATLGSALATNLQVAFTNSNGCPVTTNLAGIPVTFSAPSTGAGGRFSASESNVVTVGSDASGMATAPMFTANDAAGSYTVTASSTYGSISFSLTNVETGDSSACPATSSTGTAPTSLLGRPAKLLLGVGVMQSTPVGTRFPIRLAVTVTDARRNPLPGVLVTFAAPKRGPSGYFTLRSGGAHTPMSRTHRSRRIEVMTDACGIALAPTFTAEGHVGGYVVVASVEHLRAAFALVNERR
jgi:hypothetical protein